MDSTDTTLEEIAYAIENRCSFFIGKKRYRFSSLLLSISTRIAVFMVFLIADFAYVNSYVLTSMWSTLDALYMAIIFFVCGLLFCGYISRQILLLFHIIVRKKDAYKIAFRAHR